MDVLMQLVTKRKITGDVWDHTDYLSEFPYLGAQHV